jgi:hypothetical protein
VRLGALPGRPHLTYCLNVHPGEGVDDLVAALGAAGEVRRALGVEGDLGVGLRLSGEAAAALDADPEGLVAVRRVLREERLYAFTANAFPHGAFHRQRVKEAVYEPDWLDPARAAYTLAAARVLASLLDEQAEGSGTVSSVPLGYRPRLASAAARARAGAFVRECAGELARLRARTGARVVLALEPEPACALETTGEAITFLEDHVLVRGGDAVREHVGLCVDLCHAAVLGEDPTEALRAPERAGVLVGKVQIAAGLEVELPGPSAAGDERRALEALEGFDDGVYLHQVVEDGPAGRRAFVDLPDARRALDEVRAAGDERARRWRVHAHVPVFLERAGSIGTTRSWLRRALAELRTRRITSHLEVETYTWDVLPPEARGASLPLDVARELAWVREELSP